VPLFDAPPMDVVPKSCLDGPMMTPDSGNPPSAPSQANSLRKPRCEPVPGFFNQKTVPQW